MYEALVSLEIHLCDTVFKSVTVIKTTRNQSIHLVVQGFTSSLNVIQACICKNSQVAAEKEPKWKLEAKCQSNDNSQNGQLECNGESQVLSSVASHSRKQPVLR